MALSAGTRVGPYEILAPLGAGSMGEVYRSRDRRLGRDVAIKVIAPEGLGDPERIRRFEQEARAAGALSHPNVCAVYDVGTHEDSPFVVMELLEGESLRAILANGPLPVRRAMDYAAQVAEGLAAAHAKGIVHRDIKPENLFVTVDGHVKVLDFGLAKLTSSKPSAPPGASHATVDATQAGAILGTSAYMAPEQVRGEAVDARTDVFALGIVLFEMLIGRRPFNGTTPFAVMNAILHEEPASLSALRPEAPTDLARMLRRCLAKDPDRRIQTSKDVRNELEELQREHERGPSREPSAEKAYEQPVERQLTLTAGHVREFSDRNPRLVGYPMTYLDNRVESDTLVVLLHGVGADDGKFEPVLRMSPYRTVAPSLVGFGRRETNRPVVGMDDHSRMLRILLRELVRECRPATTILVGHSAGADQFLRMIHDGEGAGVDVAGLVAMGPNVSMETCFASKLFAHLDAGNPKGTLDVLKSLTMNIDSLSTWLVVHAYFSETFMKLGSDLAPLKRYAADLVAPFEQPGDPLADWYRAARKRIPHVRFVFSNEEAGPAESLLARHLEGNVLGDDFSESSFVIEPVHHLALLEPSLLMRHVESIVEQSKGQTGRARDR